MKSRAPSETWSLLGLCIATVSWGASFFLTKLTVDIIGVWPSLFARYNLAFLAILALFPAKFFKSAQGVPRKSFKLGALLFLAAWTQTQGLAYTSVGHSGFITSLYVPLTPLLGWIFLRRNISLRDVSCVILAIVGLYILTIGSHSGQETLRGDLWTLGTAVIYAFHIFFTERVTRQEPDSLAIGVWQFFWCALLINALFLSLWLTGGVKAKEGLFYFWEWPWIVVCSILFNAIVATDFAFVMQIVSQKSLSSLKVALIFAMEAPFAVLFAYYFRGDLLTRRELYGVGLVFLASLWPERWLRKKGVEESHGTL